MHDYFNFQLLMPIIIILFTVIIAFFCYCWRFYWELLYLLISCVLLASILLIPPQKLYTITLGKETDVIASMSIYSTIEIMSIQKDTLLLKLPDTSNKLIYANCRFSIISQSEIFSFNPDKDMLLNPSSLISSRQNKSLLLIDAKVNNDYPINIPIEIKTNKSAWKKGRIIFKLETSRPFIILDTPEYIKTDNFNERFSKNYLDSTEITIIPAVSFLLKPLSKLIDLLKIAK
jgi:hypothetical protein